MINNDFENIIYLHLCNKPILFKSVDSDFFKNTFVQKIYDLTKDFFVEFGILPFDLNNPSTDQIKEVVVREPQNFVTNPDMNIDDNVDMFIRACHNIITSDYKKYSKEWLESIVEVAWISWENSEKGMRKSIQYRRSQKITPQNVEDVIRKCNSIIDTYTYRSIVTEESKDFLDPSAHKPVSVRDLINCGFGKLNLWVSGRESGGFEPGTLSVLFAEPNLGKSIWLANIARGMMINGYNVLLVSLEMAVNKIFGRIGSSVFGIDMDRYIDFANNEDEVKRAIDGFKHTSEEDFFRQDEQGNFLPRGILRGIKFTEATAKDISAFYREEEKKLGIKYHAIILDYMTELQNSYGTRQENMYMFHKENVNDMFNDAGRYGKAWITAHQINGNSIGSDDIGMSSSAESKAILHRPDNIFGLIQMPDMKINNKYHIKNIKTRESAYKNHRIEVDINYSRMHMTENVMLNPSEIRF